MNERDSPVRADFEARISGFAISGGSGLTHSLLWRSHDPLSNMITAVAVFRGLSASIDASARFLRIEVDAIGGGRTHRRQMQAPSRSKTDLSHRASHSRNDDDECPLCLRRSFSL